MSSQISSRWILVRYEDYLEMLFYESGLLIIKTKIQLKLA